MTTHRWQRNPVALSAVLPWAGVWFLVAWPALAHGQVVGNVATVGSQRSNQVRYQLPSDGPLPRTYRVTLAIVDPQNPDWIISQFVAGQPRTVTIENHGTFTETWDGLDDNFMPVPPGKYAVKGIYMPATRWRVDGEFHTVTPQYLTAASSWAPRANQADKPLPFGGDPCGAPLSDVAVGPNGIAVFYYQYLENGLNNPRIDLNKPIGPEQFVEAFGSGGAGGGTCTATDGISVWSYSTDGGPKYVYRADGKPFGTGMAQRRDVYRPAGWVTSLAAWRDAASQRSTLYVAERGKLIETPDHQFVESQTEYVDQVVALDGATGAILGRRVVPPPLALAMHDGSLYLLHRTKPGYAVSQVPLPLNREEPHGAHPSLNHPAARTADPSALQFDLKKLFDAPGEPFDLKIDGHDRFYISDPSDDQVYQFDRSGNLLRTYGAQDGQHAGSYDPDLFISPGKLATWTDKAGADRLLIVEQGGPNRVSEWSADGKRIRDFLTLQTKANDGYAIDPEDPQHIYIRGQQNWLTRFKVDLDQGRWTVDAVWPSVGVDDAAPGFDHPQFIRRDGHKYLACARSNNIYRLDDGDWHLSAAIISETKKEQRHYYLWSNVLGSNWTSQADYHRFPLTMPGSLLRYHGNQWLDDLSLVAPDQNGSSVWRLAPQTFTTAGDPIFAGWQKLLTDPVFDARAKGTADAIHGGNELDDKFSSDWGQVDGTMADGFFVVARGGTNFGANQGAQEKISRYVPDGHGGYKLKWRTGRAALEGTARDGEIYGAIHLRRPINGLLSVVDQSRCGILLYTDEGLYVDTIFPDDRRHKDHLGIYQQPGEFFAGSIVPDAARNKILFAMGKYTPVLYEAVCWTPTENPVHRLELAAPTINVAAAQIAAPPEIALSVRGGAGAARVARFMPALGGANFGGTLLSWESCRPVTFQSDKDQTVEVRCLYDPERLYLRWHARLNHTFRPRELQPIERIFTHDRLADTLSFYIQGDPAAAAGGPLAGRPGDARFVFGIFQDGGKVRPVALGMFPYWNGPTTARPQTYATPTGKAAFAHVGPVSGAKLAWFPDKDSLGFVLLAAIPRTAIPPIPEFTDKLRTMVNFEATLGGHNKFWWANRDGSASRETYDEPTEARLYPGSWAPAEFQGLSAGVVVRNWLICGPFGGPGAEKFHEDLSGDEKDRGRAFSSAAKYPPDRGGVDLAAVFKGPEVRGYWPDPGEVRWRATTVADLDTRIVLGPSSQVWYGATWIHAPADTELEFQFQGHPQTYLRYFLNGKQVLDGEIGGADEHRVLTKSLTLARGWNQVMFRGYCVGYPPFRTGLVLTGAPEKLWTLQLSGDPPASPTKK
jgi:hypothetical protein